MNMFPMFDPCLLWNNHGSFLIDIQRGCKKIKQTIVHQNKLFLTSRNPFIYNGTHSVSI